MRPSCPLNGLSFPSPLRGGVRGGGYRKHLVFRLPPSPTLPRIRLRPKAGFGGQEREGEERHPAAAADTLSRWRFMTILLSAPRYAFAEATSVSGSARGAGID